jgi:hypothetical protein
MPTVDKIGCGSARLRAAPIGTKAKRPGSAAPATEAPGCVDIQGLASLPPDCQLVAGGIAEMEPATSGK